MNYQHIGVFPVTGSIGAEIEGINLAQSISDELFDEIRQALTEHLVLFFRNQRLEPNTQIAFTNRFGAPCPTPFVKTMDGYPEIIEVVKEADEKSRYVFGNAWHSDYSFLKQPPYVSCLHAKEVPDYGGDTLFANMILAYETLSHEMKQQLAGLVALHSAKRAYAPDAQTLQDRLENMTVKNTAAALAVIEHPLVRTQVETGRKGLFVNPIYTVGIKEMNPKEADALLEKLYKHALREIFTCRFRWQNRSVALWDNRFVQHNAMGDYLGKRRYMHRTTALGEVPV